MFRIICFIPIFVVTFLVPDGPLAGQTTIHGKMLSVDGRTIPKTVISFRQVNQTDIFSGYEDVHAEADGSYSLTISEPGLYGISFTGIYHRRVSVPILVVDQPDIELDVLLFPIYYDDGRYFENDEYHLREDRSYESVLYRDVPADSLEIRYMPGETVPFQNMLPYGEKREWWNANGFISFKNMKDRYWTEPVHLARYFGDYFGRATPIIERDLTSGLTAGEQAEYLEKYFPGLTPDDLMEIKQRVFTELSNPDIHPQQQSMLYLAYAGVLNRVEIRKRRLTNTQQQMQDTFGGLSSEEIEDELQRLDEITIDREILLQIPNQVVSAHPVWNYTQLLPQFLLNVTDGHPDFIDYFMEIIKDHPHEFIIRRVAMALIREIAGDFETVEEMEVYQIIVERFGEGDLARRAHETFRGSRLEGR